MVLENIFIPNGSLGLFALEEKRNKEGFLRTAKSLPKSFLLYKDFVIFTPYKENCNAVADRSL